MNQPNLIVLFKPEEDSDLVLPMIVVGDDCIDDGYEYDTYTQEIAIEGVAYYAEVWMPHSVYVNNGTDFVKLFDMDDNFVRDCEVVYLKQIDYDFKK